MLTIATMGMAFKKSRDRLLMVGVGAVAAVSAVACYFAWKTFRAAAAPGELSNEDGEKELQDLKVKAEGVHTYSEGQGGFTAQEFEKFVAEEDGKLQAEVPVDIPLMPIVEKEFAVKDSSRTEEYQHGKSGGKFEDLEIRCDGFLGGAHLFLTSLSDEIERFSMENELQEDNLFVNFISPGPCIGHDVSDNGPTETVHGISNGIADDSNPLVGDFEGFSSSNLGTPLGQVAQQVEFDNSNYSDGIQGISSKDFVTEPSSFKDVGYDEFSRQKVAMFLGNGAQASGLENQSDGQNAAEFNQTGIDAKGISCEGPVIGLSNSNDVGELEGQLSDDGQHPNRKVADAQEPSDMGIALEHEFSSSVNKGMECLGPHEGLAAESSNSSDESCNKHPSDNGSESSNVESSEHEDSETTTVCCEKPLDGQIIPLLELDNMTNTEKMEGPSLGSPVTEAAFYVDKMSGHVLESGILCPFDIDARKHFLDDSLSIQTTADVGYQTAADGQFVLQAELGNIGYNEKMGDLNSVPPCN